MIKKIRVTVDGKAYEAIVEIPDDPAPATPEAAPVHSAAPAGTETSSPPQAPDRAAGDVSSPLAGHVVGISVTTGQAVKKSDPLLSIEAMKMNTYVLAPADGKVAKVHVNVGEAVAEGQTLITIA